MQKTPMQLRISRCYRHAERHEYERRETGGRRASLQVTRVRLQRRTMYHCCVAPFR